MIIRRIHIDAMGPLRNFDCELYSGMNVIRGDNESGKTSLAMFIKFMLYGLSGRSVDGVPSERRKYVNWDTGSAGGYMIVGQGGKEFRIERTLLVSRRPGSEKETVSETVTVTDTGTGERIHEIEECPGAALLGVPEQVFVNSVFSGQNKGSRIDGEDTAAAVENMLFSADETVNVKKAAENLEKFRRTLLHKNGGGGEIAELREKCASLRERLDTAQLESAEIIELESSLEANKRRADIAAADIERYKAKLNYYDALCLCRDGEDAREADRKAAEAENELRQALTLCCEGSRLSEARGLAATIEKERAGSAEYRDRLCELEVGAANLVDADAPEDPEGVLAEFRRADKNAGVLLGFAVTAAVFGVVTGAFAAILYAMKNQAFLLPLAGAALFVVISGILFILRGCKFSRMREICKMFGEEDEDGLVRAVDYEMSRRAEAETLSRRAEVVRMSLEESGERAETLETEAMAVAASFEDCCRFESGEKSRDALERLRQAIALAERRQVFAEGARAAYESAAARAAAKWERVPKDKLAAAEEYVRRARMSGGTEGYPEEESAADEIRRVLSFESARIDALGKSIHNDEVKLAAKRAATESPAILWDELSECTEKLKQKTARHDAAVLALETLSVAGENIRRDIVPRIVRRASKLFTDATDGRYESLGSGSTFRLSAVMDGHTRDSALLSSGTEELAYVCLRVALAQEMFGEKKPPLIFDESLAFMDSGRSAAASDVLSASGNQVLLFTCKPGEGVGPTLVMKRR